MTLEKDMHIGEIDLLINSLNVEIMMNLIRNEINEGDSISKKYKKNYTQLLTQTTKDEQLRKKGHDGIATNLLIKSEICKGATMNEIKRNHQSLKTTL